jgi:Kef-type K+ transport system membrane component KefB
MNETAGSLPLLMLVIGTLIVLAVVVQIWLERLGFPSLVGYLVLGAMLSMADRRWGLIGAQGETVVQFFAGIGVIVLLFRVGLESNLHELVDKLPRATPIWIGNVALSGVPGYLVARYLLDLALIPSLFIAIALTATSIAVSVAVWREAGVLNTTDGELLLDVAEMDDVSGVALLAMVLAIVPALTGDGDDSVVPILAATTGMFLLKAVFFGGLCLVFARYAERPLTAFLARQARPHPILFVVGIGIVIAALAGQLGFSLAIGALFAGMVFSRDPEIVRMNTSFEPIHDFFVPFFFIGVGLNFDPDSLASASFLAAVLLVVAVLGKVVGAGVPALLATGWTGATLIGVSMVPRAEIAMVVMHEGRKLGADAVPADVYGAMVIISAATCLVSPIVVAWLLRRWMQGGSAQSAGPGAGGGDY